MKVFKFGGASVKDASGVLNVANVLRHFPADDLVIVVSAMGKTTNALEEVVWTYREGRDVHPLIDRLRAAHLSVLAAVAPAGAAAMADLVHQFDRLEAAMRGTPSDSVDRDYDQIVSFGEVWSTLIVSASLTAAGLSNTWVDACMVVCTDSLYRSARIDWTSSADHAPTAWAAIAERPRRLLTQGFIGCAPDGTTTTLAVRARISARPSSHTSWMPRA